MGIGMKQVVLALAAMQATMIGAAMPAAASPPAPRVVAHRGRTDLSQPENSLRTMRHAIAQGVTMMEMDLKPGRDGTLYLLHDGDLDRTTDGHGPLAKLGDEAAQKTHLKNGTGQLTDETLVPFEAVARWAQGEPRAHLMLDIKTTSPTTIIPIVRAHGLTGRVLVRPSIRRWRGPPSRPIPTGTSRCLCPTPMLSRATGRWRAATR
jgi:glycerophosphoryl diester phosphodiesterase